MTFGLNGFQITLVLCFVAVLLLVEAAFLWWRHARGADTRRLAQRVQQATRQSLPERQSAVRAPDASREWAFVRRFLLGRRGFTHLNAMLAQSGLDWPLSTFLGACIACAAAATVVGVLVLHSPMLVAGAVVAAVAGAVMFVAFRRRRRLARMEAQLPDLLDHISRAMRAGHGLTSALNMAGDEMEDPLAQEFRAVHDEINYGVSLQQALIALSQRVPLADIRMFVVAVQVQREAGGNLTEVLTQLSRLIRERMRLHAKVKVLSAEGRMSAWILCVMPFMLGGGMYLANPEFMRPLWTDPMGISILKTLLVMMALGIVATRRIARIRF